MKTFRISFTIRDGDHEYGDAIAVKAERLSPAAAAKYLLTEHYDFENWKGMSRALRAGRECWIDGERLIKDFAVTKVPPVLIIVEDGAVQSIDNIPADVVIVVRDFDYLGPDHPQLRRSRESGDLYMESVWESR